MNEVIARAVCPNMKRLHAWFVFLRLDTGADYVATWRSLAKSQRAITSLELSAKLCISRLV